MLPNGETKHHVLLGESESVDVRVVAQLDLLGESHLLPGLVKERLPIVAGQDTQYDTHTYTHTCAASRQVPEPVVPRITTLPWVPR